MKKVKGKISGIQFLGLDISSNYFSFLMFRIFRDMDNNRLNLYETFFLYINWGNRQKQISITLFGKTFEVTKK